MHLLTFLKIMTDPAYVGGGGGVWCSVSGCRQWLYEAKCVTQQKISLALALNALQRSLPPFQISGDF